MRSALYKEFGKYTVWSVGFYFALFLILYIIEAMFPALKGVLLQWHDRAFVVGIPASVIGTAYVLTIRNPKNYIGFIGGIIMALLLAVQFALLQQWSLSCLYVLVFVPFMVFSIVHWRKLSLAQEAAEKPLRPTWLATKYQVLNLLILIIITALDAGFITNFRAALAADDLLVQCLSGLMISSSVLANFWLIYQKLDAWVWWIVYAVAGLLLYITIGNIFSSILFLVFFVVNGGAAVAWLKIYKQLQ